MRNGLTFTMVFEAQSANYGEGVGNISSLKKMTKGDGKVYTYLSRQAIRYNIVKEMNCDDTPVTDAGVVQFAPEAQIDKYPEIDLFGYMKTSTGKEKGEGGQSIRSAVVRLSNAVSLEPYNSDLDFLTNMGLASRGNYQNAIAQSEIHNSLYAYTITVDMDRVGIDKDIEIPKEERARRVKLLLDTVQFLYRDIKGRRENLSPVFAVGGLYERKNPYFEGRIELNKLNLNTDIIKETIESCDDTKEHTYVGCFKGKFKNIDKIENELKPVSISEFFAQLKKEVDEYYA